MHSIAGAFCFVRRISEICTSVAGLPGNILNYFVIHLKIDLLLRKSENLYKIFIILQVKVAIEVESSAAKISELYLLKKCLIALTL